MRPCPHCRVDSPETAVECPACGLVFAKWRVDVAGSVRVEHHASRTPAGPRRGLTLAAALLLAVAAGAVWIRGPAAPAVLGSFGREPDNSAILRGQWPPRVGQPFPDLRLRDQDGELVRLSSFKGKVLMVEMVGMTCPACQGYAGSGRYGPYGNIEAFPGTAPFSEYFQSRLGVPLGGPEVVLVQLLLYGMDMQAPKRGDAKTWADHFRLSKSRNQYVLAGTPEFIGQASYDLIPGFQLVDRDFILRIDHAGHNPRHRVAELMAESESLLRGGVAAAP